MSSKISLNFAIFYLENYDPKWDNILGLGFTVFKTQDIKNQKWFL